MTKECCFCVYNRQCHGLDYWERCKTKDLENFVGNQDWLEYESLKKENEELKCKIQSYKYERAKLRGY